MANTEVLYYKTSIWAISEFYCPSSMSIKVTIIIMIMLQLYFMWIMNLVMKPIFNMVHKLSSNYIGNYVSLARFLPTLVN